MTAPLLSDAIREASDPTAVMRRVTEQALALIGGADGASLEVCVEDDVLEYVACSGTLEPSVGLRLHVTSSLSGRSVLEGVLQRCDDARTDDRVDRDACERLGIRSMMCLPLGTGRGRTPLLKVSSTEPAAFSSDDEAVLRELGEFLETAVGAASELAAVTARLLDAGDVHPGEADTARFVANVLQPGLADDVAAVDRVEAVIRDSAFALVLQPIVDLRDGICDAAEVLSRFSAAPVRGPDVWFAEAYAVGLGVPLELAVVTSVHEILPSVPATVRVTVNIGAAAAMDPSVQRALAALPPERLCVELTEHAQVTDYADLDHALRRIRSSGVLLAIDDTGSGYSSLQHILRLRPDVIKLDRELVRGIDTDPARQALATALVQLAEGLGARVVAEGLETMPEAAEVLRLGITHGQGYVLHRPAAPGHVQWSGFWHGAR